MVTRTIQVQGLFGVAQPKKTDVTSPIGVVYATLIAAEIIAGSTGLGWMILDAGRFLRSEYVFVGIVLLGLLGLLLDRLLLAIELRVVHWAGRD